ncbi:MAG: MFS transporter [Solirubrobacteraceae bacterium]|nr:MFS transporter [Solirubrobacteraceae bacterium]
MTQDHANPHHARRWAILGVIGLAQLMVVLDATIVNIALPSAQQALEFSNENRQWIVTSYALAFGSLLLLGGRIGDLFGRKRVFITGLLGFSVASAIGGAAQSFEMLVAARALQGGFGALLAPAALSLLTTTFTEPGEKAKAFGIFGAIAGGGGGLGLLLGGVLTEYLSWRWSLYVNLVFAVPAAVAAGRLLHHSGRTSDATIDIPGTVAASVGLFLLVFGFSRAETEGWGDVSTVGSLVASAVMLTAFIVLQRTTKHPLLPLSILLDRARGGSFIAMALSGAGMFAVFLFLTYFLQQSMGMTPVTTGFAFLPMIAGIIFSASLSTTQLLPKFGPRPLVTLGMLLGSASMVLLTGIDGDTTYAAGVLPALIGMGVGMGLIFAPAMQTATFGVADSDAGVASATVNTMQQVGGSIGTALLSTLAASAVTSFADGRTNPDVMAAAAIHGYTTAFAWAAGIFLIGAVVCGSLLPGGTVELEPGAEPVFAH